MLSSLPRIRALRYVTPLREGESLPAVMEADDEGTYVVKFRGCRTGAEGPCRRDHHHRDRPGDRDPHPTAGDHFLRRCAREVRACREVQDPLKASTRTNPASDFLPGSFGYDGATPPPLEDAARILWLDAYTLNSDRTWANPNIIVWHGIPYAIDHEASLWFHHSWQHKDPDPDAFARRPFDARTHVLAEVCAPVAEIADDVNPASEGRSARPRCFVGP